MTRILSGPSLASTESCTSVSGLDVVFMAAPGPGPDWAAVLSAPFPSASITLYLQRNCEQFQPVIFPSRSSSSRALSGHGGPGFHLPAQPYRVVRCVKSHVGPMYWIARLHGVQQLDLVGKPQGERAHTQGLGGWHERADHGKSALPVQYLPGSQVALCARHSVGAKTRGAAGRPPPQPHRGDRDTDLEPDQVPALIHACIA